MGLKSPRISKKRRRAECIKIEKIYEPQLMPYARELKTGWGTMYWTCDRSKLRPGEIFYGERLNCDWDSILEIQKDTDKHKKHLKIRKARKAKKHDCNKM